MSDVKILKLPSRNGKDVTFDKVWSLVYQYSADQTMLNFIYDSICVVDTFRVLSLEVTSSDSIIVSPLKDTKKTF